METLFNTMTCHELSKLSLLSWPEGSGIFRAGGGAGTHLHQGSGGRAPPTWGGHQALTPAPAQNLSLAVNKTPGQGRKVKKIKTQITKPEPPHLGWKKISVFHQVKGKTTLAVHQQQGSGSEPEQERKSKTALFLVSI